MSIGYLNTWHKTVTKIPFEKRSFIAREQQYRSRTHATIADGKEKATPMNIR
jgi:hypothetical protein